MKFHLFDLDQITLVLKFDLVKVYFDWDYCLPVYVDGNTNLELSIIASLRTIDFPKCPRVLTVTYSSKFHNAHSKNIKISSQSIVLISSYMCHLCPCLRSRHRQIYIEGQNGFWIQSVRQPVRRYWHIRIFPPLALSIFCRFYGIYCTYEENDSPWSNCLISHVLF